MKSMILGIIVGLVLISTEAMADLTPQENSARLRQIDRNNDGFLQPDEVDLGLWYRASGGKVDLKMPPTVDQVANASANNAIFKLLRYEFETDHGKKDKYSFDEIKADFDFRLPKSESPLPGGETKPIPKEPKSSILLRRSLDKTPLLFDTDKSSALMTQGADKLASEGALFSYGHAFNNGADEWLAQGLLAYEIPFEGGLFGKTSIGRWLLSMEFSRVDFGGSGKPSNTSPRFKSEDNVANFGATYEALVNWPQGVAGFTGSSLRLNALWKTDWDFESQIPTAEVEWTLYNGSLGFGSINTTTSEYVWFRVDPTIHGDAGYVFEDGKWTKSIKGDTFGHIGPKIGVMLIPFPKVTVFKDNPIVLAASFGEFIDITKQSKEIRAVTADISWYIRRPGSGLIGPVDPGVALTFSFRNFRNVENQTDDNSLLLAFAVGF
jgi:hypothetical protein